MFEHVDDNIEHSVWVQVEITYHSAKRGTFHLPIRDCMCSMTKPTEFMSKGVSSSAITLEYPSLSSLNKLNFC